VLRSCDYTPLQEKCLVSTDFVFNQIQFAKMPIFDTNKLPNWSVMNLCVTLSESFKGPVDTF
jgi:hypothetical protein